MYGGRSQGDNEICPPIILFTWSRRGNIAIFHQTGFCGHGSSSIAAKIILKLWNVSTALSDRLANGKKILIIFPVWNEKAKPIGGGDIIVPLCHPIANRSQTIFKLTSFHRYVCPCVCSVDVITSTITLNESFHCVTMQHFIFARFCINT